MASCYVSECEGKMATAYKMFQLETTSIMAVVVETAMTEIGKFLTTVPNSYVCNPESEVRTELS